MAIAGGRIRRLVVDRVEYQAAGDLELATSFEKKEVSHVTLTGVNYKKNPMAGMISIKIANVNTVDTEEIKNYENVEVYIEIANGGAYSGRMFYEGDNKIDESDGTFQLDMRGTLLKTE